MAKQKFNVVNGGRINSLPPRPSMAQGSLRLLVNPQFLYPSLNPARPIHLIDIRDALKKHPHLSKDRVSAFYFFHKILAGHKDERPYLYLMLNKDDVIDYRVYPTPHTIAHVQSQLDINDIDATVIISLDLQKSYIEQARQFGFSQKLKSWADLKRAPIDCIDHPQIIPTTPRTAEQGNSAPTALNGKEPNP